MGVEMPNPRGSVKLKLAIEFCRFTGAQGTFRSLFPVASKGEGEYHNAYSPADIRRARLQLMGVDVEPVRGNRLPPVIYSRMAKGGVGKTTICGNAAACMASMGYKILMIDSDPQASLTSLFGIDWSTEEICHIGHLLRLNEEQKPIDWGASVRPLYDGGMLDIIASDITLANAEAWLSNVPNREGAVERLFEENVEFFGRYDAIVIDSAPGTTQLSNSLMYASKKILAVTRLDGHSLKAMEVLAQNVQEMNRAFKDLKLTVHLVANGFDPRMKTCKESLDILRETYPGLMDPNIIPAYASFAKQISLFSDGDSGPILEREPTSAAAKAIIDLTRSLIGYYDVQLGGLLPVVPQSARTTRRQSAKVAA
jgi:chromosome partitioning protein